MPEGSHKLPSAFLLKRYQPHRKTIERTTEPGDTYGTVITGQARLEQESFHCFVTGY